MIDPLVSPEKFQQLVQPLIGLNVARAWKGYGSAIFLELGELKSEEWKGRRYEEGEACIAVEWDWRVESKTSVLFGSSNHGPQIVDGISSLENSSIVSLAAVGNVPELVVHFSNGHSLRSMVMVTGDPEWWIRLLDGGRISAQAGRLQIGSVGKEPNEQCDEVAELTKNIAARWGVPRAESAGGKCADCAWYVRLDGNFYLLDYGVCVQSESPFDGRAVNCKSGCSWFSAGNISAA